MSKSINGRGVRVLHVELVRLRKTKKLTQEELAEKLGITRSRLSQYELGTRNPDYETLELIANYFGVSTDQLLGLDKTRASLEETEIEAINRETNDILKTAKTVEQAKLFNDLAKTVFKK